MYKSRQEWERAAKRWFWPWTLFSTVILLFLWSLFVVGLPKVTYGFVAFVLFALVMIWGLLGLFRLFSAKVDVW